MYWENHRRPLRTYRRINVREFAIDGDVEPEAVWSPEADGYEQQTMTYGRQNLFNASIRAAALDLIFEVGDQEVRSMLERIVQILSPQGPVRRVSD
jgi:hypothetical protein